MRDLRIAVCVKVVPKPEEIQVDPETNLLKRQNVHTEINPPDMNALEMALRLKDRHKGKIFILSMGPPDSVRYLKAALSMGADHAYLMSDRAFAGADTLATTYTLAMGIRKLGGVDVVICGEESSDGATGQVPQGLAEWLDYPQLTLLTSLDLDLRARVARGKRSIKGGYEILEVPLPCVVSAKTACNEPRFMDFHHKAHIEEPGHLTIWDAASVETDPEYIGKNGSPTWVSGLTSAAVRERKRIVLSGLTEEIAQKLAVIIRTHKN